jgi:hypothetical protein
MRLEESLEIQSTLERHIKKIGSVINLGSGDIRKLKKDKPWVFKHVFDPLTKKSLVIHADIDSFNGACQICNLTKSNALDFINTTPKPRLFILANVLEHVPKKSVKIILNKIFKAMNKGDFFLITAPYSYPYHPDPIDSMYRPEPKAIAGLIKLMWLDMKIIECGSFKEEFGKMSLSKKIRKILKLFFIFQSINNYLRNAHRLIYLFKSYKITMLLGKK